MSTGKNLPEDLANRLKPCPADFKRVEFFMKRAAKDLKSATFLKSSDLEGGYELLYDALLHTGLAYMVSRGVQPDIRGKHKTVVEYIAHEFPKRFESKIQFYDRMRKKRHQLIYEPGPAGCTEKEFAEAELLAREFLSLAGELIRAANPQREFDF